ncbi:hypothetical protein ACFYSF_27325 [Streptomyces canus]|uniref:hypothetical protein n=1 Tax=Streptomyces canus TaxID=58343 RepID=UPI003698A669
MAGSPLPAIESEFADVRPATAACNAYDPGVIDAYPTLRLGETLHAVRALPADPDTLILHHGRLRAMVQGSYGD